MLLANLDVVCPQQDQIREVLNDLGPPGSEEEALGVPGKQSSLFGNFFLTHEGVGTRIAGAASE